MNYLPAPDAPIMKPRISIVIPTQNNVALLVECLQAVEQLDYPTERLEVVVVDNASSDRTRDTLGRRFSSVRLVPLESNTGFAAACNSGAEAAGGQFVAFLNNDAIPDPHWLNALLAGLEAGLPGTVCAASKIVSRDGREVEYDGAGSNMFAAGRPHSTWGWRDLPEAPGTGSPVMFASGGAMLIDRSVFIEAGGFDSGYFAYFEDVDLGWRLWLLGYAVAFAPDAVVRHIGGATGRRAGAHRRYTLWESNSLATVIKNYETGHMERILSAALLLEFKRALMAAGDAVDPTEYALAAPRDTNQANVDRLPKVCVAHLAAIDRLNTMLPHLMGERARIQARRRRPDSEILPLMGSLYAPQFAGPDYAEAALKLAATVGLFEMTDPVVPPRVLVTATSGTTEDAQALAGALSPHVSVAVAHVDGALKADAAAFAAHTAAPGSTTLVALVESADVVLALGDTWRLDEVKTASRPVAVIGARDSGASFTRFDAAQVDEIVAFCRNRGVAKVVR